MNKIIVVNKPKGITSYDAIKGFKRKYDTRKVGHCGTLDPMATGVLVVALNKATKIIQFIDKDEKEYIATAKFGLKTDTGDITGEVIANNDHIPTKEDLEATFKEFVGKIMQTPPMYSAKKINGKKLYEYARQGIEVDVPAKEVEILTLELISFKENEFVFKAIVSKGTFIRTLIEDIAEKLGSVATMTELDRTRSGNFTKEKEEWTMEEAISKFPRLEITDKEREDVLLGRKIKRIETGRFQLFNKDELIAIVDIDGIEARIVRVI